MTGISLTAKNQGYFILLKDGVKVSQHLAEREAIDAGVDLKMNNPGSVIGYIHDYTVVIELKND
jgi:hypothetical protein